jgi:hypothetical protein
MRIAGVVGLLAVAMALGTAGALRNQQNTATNSHLPANPTNSPVWIVTELWNAATRGDLLTREGRTKIAWLFVKPPNDYKSEVTVVSNEWGRPSVTSSTNSAVKVAVYYSPAGQIDSRLRYMPAPNPQYGKFGIAYTVILTQTYHSRAGANGKLEKKMPGDKVWEIQAPDFPPFPFTTVNTAIRYVLEQRAKTENPEIRKNADATLAALLKLH